MRPDDTYELRPIGFVRSRLTDRKDAPRQGYRGAPAATVEVEPAFADAVEGIEAGSDVFLLTWLHLADRGVLRVHPESDPANPRTQWRSPVARAAADTGGGCGGLGRYRRLS